MLVQVNDSGEIVITPGVSVADELAWTKGRLVFRDAPATEVAADVGRRYDLVIQLPESAFSNVRLTALFDAETTTQALDLLAVALNARYSRDGRVVTFTPTRNVLRSKPLPRLPLNADNVYGR
jgi:transmembrane sensor